MNFYKLIFITAILFGMCVGAVQAAGYLSEYDSYLVLNLDMNQNPDHPTWFNDSSSNNIKFTTVGAATTNTTSKVLGNASANFPDGASYIYTPNSTLLDYGSKNFTIKFDLLKQSSGTLYRIFGHLDSAGSGVAGLRALSNTADRIVVTWNNASGEYNYISSASIPSGQYNQIRIVRNGSYLYMYINGTYTANTGGLGTSDFIGPGAIPIFSASNFSIGRQGDYAAQNLVGNIDAFTRWDGATEPIVVAYPQIYEVDQQMSVAPVASFFIASVNSSYQNTTNVYKGQLHAHSYPNSTDAADTPIEMVTAYKNAGYNFTTISDHDNLTVTHGISDILFVEGIEQTGSSEHHILGFDITTNYTGNDRQSIITNITEQGGFATIAHPATTGYVWTLEELLEVTGYNAIEIFNTVNRNDQAASEAKWDEVLSSGRRVFAIASDDSHDVSDPAQFNGGWIQVFSDDLSTDSITDAMKRGNYYSSNGSVISNILVSDRHFKVIMPNSSTVQWIINEGVITQTNTTVNSAEYVIIGSEKYVRARITDLSTNKMAWTNPVFIDQLQNAAGTEPLSLQLIDSSTNTPTSWSYQFKDVTGNNTMITFCTTQNCIHTFPAGNFSINLTASNAKGSNTSTQVTWVNVSAGNSISANFTISNTTGYEPFLTHFTDTSTTNEATIDAWYWDFGDGITSTVQNPPDHTYVNNGTYSANLTITNISYSLVSTKLATITVYNQPPVADFTASNLSGNPPLVVRFNDTSTGQDISWNWSFGEGNISSEQNPLHIFENIGEYQANLTVTNDGGSSTKLQNITVALYGAYFIANKTIGAIPFPVAFTDTSVGNYDTWNWSVDDGVLHWYNKTDYSTRNLEYTFNNVGSWRVNLSVQNISELAPIYSTSMNITATNIPPVASFINYPSTGSTSTVFMFNDTSTGLVTTRNWSFGDGNYSTSQNVTYTFPSNGVYNVNLTVSNDGGSSSVVHSITISEFTVTTSFTPSYGVVPLSVTYNETVTGLLADNYYWEFGDGNTSTDRDGVHTYTSIGSFNVNHRVINDSTTIWSNTTNAVTTIGGYALPNFTANVTAGDYPLDVQFTDTSTYVNATPSSWYWVFGDGYTSVLQNPSHTYLNAGTYNVNFSTTTEYGTNSTLKTGYINVGGVAANGRQDVILVNSHNITLYVKDANSGNLISYASVIDELGHELTSYGNGVFTGYYSTGQHSFVANATNYYTNRATYLVSGNLIQTIYLTQVAISTSTTWYTPKTIQISFTDVYGNQLRGASVRAHYNETTLPNGVSDLISNYGMNANVANEALNGTLMMSGSTDYQGSIVFTMLSTIKYDVAVTYGGQTNYYSIYPQDSQYQFKFIAAVAADNIWDDLYANGNTKVWATDPDAGNVTFWWSFQDMTSLTTEIDYFLKDVDLNTIVYTETVLSPVAGNIYQVNYTVPNVRGKNYIAYVNYTRDV